MHRIAHKPNIFLVSLVLFGSGILFCVLAILLSFATFAWRLFPPIGNVTPFRAAFTLLFCMYTSGAIWFYCEIFSKRHSSDFTQRVATTTSVCIGGIILGSNYAVTGFTDNVSLAVAASTTVGAVVAGVQWAILRKSVSYLGVLMAAVVWFFLCWGYALYVFLPDAVRNLS